MACRLFGAKPLSIYHWWVIVNWTLRNKIQTFSFTIIHLKSSSAEWRPFCPRGDELNRYNHWNGNAPTDDILGLKRSDKRHVAKSLFQFAGFRSRKFRLLTHIPLVPHMCGSEIGQHWFRLQHVWRLANTWTNAHILSNDPLGTNFSEIRIEIRNISFMKTRLKIPSAK